MSAQLEEVVERPDRPDAEQLAPDLRHALLRGCVRGDVGRAEGRPVAGVDGPGRVRVGRGNRRRSAVQRGWRRVRRDRPRRRVHPVPVPLERVAGQRQTAARVAAEPCPVDRHAGQPHPADGVEHRGKVVGVVAWMPHRRHHLAGSQAGQPRQAAEGVPGAQLREDDVLLGEQRGRLGEPHRLAHVPHPVPRIGDLAGGDEAAGQVGQVGALGFPVGDAAGVIGELVEHRVEQGGVIAAGDPQRPAVDPVAGQPLAEFLDRLRVAGQDAQLRGVDGGQRNPVVQQPGHRRLGQARPRTSPRPGSARPAHRGRTPGASASAREKTPARHAATYSPRLCPTIRSGVTPRASSVRARAYSVTNSAGWISRGCASSRSACSCPSRVGQRRVRRSSRGRRGAARRIRRPRPGRSAPRGTGRRPLPRAGRRALGRRTPAAAGRRGGCR